MLTPSRLAPAAPAKAPFGIGVRGERRAAQHGEEPDHAGDDGDDRGDDPGVDHEAGEHQARLELAAVAAGQRRRRLRRA